MKGGKQIGVTWMTLLNLVSDQIKYFYRLNLKVISKYSRKKKEKRHNLVTHIQGQ